MEPTDLEGWDHIPAAEEGHSSYFKKTIGLNELSIEIKQEQPLEFRGRIESTDRSLNIISIDYEIEDDMWVSTTNYPQPGSIGRIGRGPRVGRELCGIKDMAEFLETLEKEIQNTSWNEVRKKNVL